MAIIDASPADLRQALVDLRARYRELAEPRRWYSGLVCAVLVRSGRLPEWTDWALEPPHGTDDEMTPMVDWAIRQLFECDASAVMRVLPGGAADALDNPHRVIVDPLRQPGRTATADSLCVVADRRRIDVAFTDPSWKWSAAGAPLPPEGYGQPTEYKASNDYQQQQGIYCALAAEDLFALGEEDASTVLSIPRPQCEHRIIVSRPRRAKSTDNGPPPSMEQPICALNENQCAAKQSASSGPGGPRSLIPYSNNSKRKLLAPGGLDRMLDDANSNGAALPALEGFALIVDFLRKSGGTALDANRIYELVSPEHATMLFQ